MTIPADTSRRNAILTAIGAVAISAVALYVLYLQFRSVSLHAVAAAAAQQPHSRIWFALLCTAISFAALASYDAFAARIGVPGRVGLGTALLAGGTSHGVSNMLGFHAVTATAVRYRLYRHAGLDLEDIARIISLSSAALALGFATMMAAALLASPFFHGASFDGDMRSPAPGAALAALLGFLIVWLSRKPRVLSVFSFRLTLPPARLALIQMAIGAIETAASIAVLYVLLPTDLAPPFASFSIAMILAVLLGTVSHAPGGLGVFDASIVSILGGTQRADLLAALLLYRLIYFVVPFAVAVTALGLFEVHTRVRTRSG